jgi:branched-chain amino acid transport system permease protein
MDKFLGLTVAGLATGAIYAVAASGLVLTYATTGTFNFAHGAIGMIGAFLYWQLHYAWGWPTLVSLAAVLLLAGPLFGATIERVIMRRLEGTSETTRLVVTISLLLALLGVAVTVWDPNEPRPLRQFFQGDFIELVGIRIPWHQLVSLAVAALVAIGLRLLLYRTRQGVTMRASVDNRSLAALNGARPERAAMLSWAIGCSLAALSGVLVAPTLTLSAVPLTLLIINAYGAAVFGRLRSLPLTFVGAIVLGLLHDYGVGYLSSTPARIEPYVRGLVDAIPAIVLFVVVLVLPASRLGRVTKAREVSVKPDWGGSVGLAVGVVVASAMAVPLLADGDLVSLGKVWGLAIVGLSMVPLVGLSGQLSLSQLSFGAIGAIAYAHLGWTSPVALLWAALVGAIVAVLVALPVIRLQGVYVALATAAFTVICDRWLFQMPGFSMGTHRFDVFQNGVLEVHRPDVFGIDLSSPGRYFIYAAAVFAALMLCVVALRRSTYGIRLIAIKDGPAAVATSGINVNLAKVGVFALSGAIAGIGGAVLSAAEPSGSGAFDLVAGLPLLLTMVLMGISSAAAPIAVGLLLGSTLPAKAFSNFAKWQNILIGLAGIGLGNNPNGATADVRPLGARLKADRLVLAGLLVVTLGLYGLRRSDAFDNGTYIALTLLAVIVALGVAGRRAARSAQQPTEAPVDDDFGAGSVTALLHGRAHDTGHGLHAPPEVLGLTEPVTDADLAALDDAIDLASVGDGRKG